MSDTPSIAFLIGAGFSAPKGYPIGNQMNDMLVNCKDEPIPFHTDGTLVFSLDGKKPDYGYKNSYDREFDFLKELIAWYHTNKGPFDYEEFYDTW